jgi:hypothetical protein
MPPHEGSDFILGGFFITRPAPRADYMDASLVPARVITGSGCIATFAPDTWALSWVTDTEESRLEEVRRFGLPASSLPSILKWATERFDKDFGWQNVLFTLPAARDFVATHLPSDHDAEIVALVLHMADVDRFISECAPVQGSGEPGVFTMVSARMPAPPGGAVIGSDVLGYEYGGAFHSYLCHGLEKDFASRLNVRPNGFGLYDSHETARGMARMIGDESLGEDVPWNAWRLLRYERA